MNEGVTAAVILLILTVSGLSGGEQAHIKTDKVEAIMLLFTVIFGYICPLVNICDRFVCVLPFAAYLIFAVIEFSRQEAKPRILASVIIGGIICIEIQIRSVPPQPSGIVAEPYIIYAFLCVLCATVFSGNAGESVLISTTLFAIMIVTSSYADASTVVFSQKHFAYLSLSGGAASFIVKMLKNNCKRCS